MHCLIDMSSLWTVDTGTALSSSIAEAITTLSTENFSTHRWSVLLALKHDMQRDPFFLHATAYIC